MNTIKVFLTSGGRIANLQKDFPLYAGQYQNKLLNIYVPTAILSPKFKNLSYIGQITVETLTGITDTLDNFVLTERGRSKRDDDIVEVIYINRDVEPNTTTYYEYKVVSSSWVSNEVVYFSANQLFGTAVKIGCESVSRSGNIVKSDVYNMRYLKNLNYNGEEYALYERKLPMPFTYYSGIGLSSPKMIINVVNIDIEQDKIISLITSQTCTLEVLPSSTLDNDEPIQPSDIDDIIARLNEINAELQGKQDKSIPNATTSNKTVLGAINELDGRVNNNTSNIEQNINNINDLNNRVITLEEKEITGMHYVGTLTVQTLTNINTALNNFVDTEEQRLPKSGDIVIVILEKEHETDETYQYIYGADGWDGHPIPPMEKAGEGVYGIVRGTTQDDGYDVVVSITNGDITDIYVKFNGEFVRLSNALGLLKTSVNNIISGTQIVGEAEKAEKDKDGNVISSTYLKTSSGATMDYVKNYALPKEFNDVLYVTEDGYKKEPRTETTPVATVQDLGLGERNIMSCTYTLSDVKFQLGRKNSYNAKFYVKFDRSESVRFRLETYYYSANAPMIPILLSSELSEELIMVSNDTRSVLFNNVFDELGNTILQCSSGDKITQMLFIERSASQIASLSVYSDTVFKSILYLYTNSQVIYTSQGFLGQENSYTAQSLQLINDTLIATFPEGTHFTENTEYEIRLPASSGTISPYIFVKFAIQDYTLGTYDVKCPYGYLTYLNMAQLSLVGGGYRFKVFSKIERDKAVIYVDTPNLNSVKPVIIHATGSTSVSGYDVPVLDLDLMTIAYNSFIEGKSVVIESSDKKEYFNLIQADIVEGAMRLIIPYYSYGFLTYYENLQIEFNSIKVITEIATYSGSTPDYDITLANNKRIVFDGVVASIDITLPTGNIPLDFMCELVIGSGGISAISYPTGIEWSGTDVTYDGTKTVFTPTGTKPYNVLFFNNGSSVSAPQWQAIVRGATR